MRWREADEEQLTAHRRGLGPGIVHRNSASGGVVLLPPVDEPHSPHFITISSVQNLQ